MAVEPLIDSETARRAIALAKTSARSSSKAVAGSASMAASPRAATIIAVVSGASCRALDRQAILLVGGDKSGVGEKRFYKRLIAKAWEPVGDADGNPVPVTPAGTARRGWTARRPSRAGRSGTWPFVSAASCG